MKNNIKLCPLLLSLSLAPLSLFAQDQQASGQNGNVIAVSGSNVVIDLGTRSGIKGGEKLLVTTRWEITDVDGNKSWKGEREIGFLRVVAVGEDQALADLVSGSASKGDTVKILSGLSEQVASGQEASQRLNAWINAYNSGEVTRWMDFWAEDAEWVSPNAVLQGKAAIWNNAEKRDWDKKRYVETRRIVYGDSIAWEGVWEASDESSGTRVKRPLVLLIDFNQEGKIKRLSSYYDLKSGSAQTK